MAEPLTIMQFASSSSWNGEAAHVAGLCRSLAALGQRVVLAYRTRRKGERVTLWEEKLPELSVAEAIPLAMDSGFYPGCLARDLWILRKRFQATPPIDVLHAHRSQDHWLAGFATLTRHWKGVLIRTRHVTQPWSPHAFDRWLYGRTGLALSTCRQIDRIFESTGLIQHRAVLHGGVDISRFHPGISGQSIRNELKLSPDERLICAIGHLDPVKGYEYFIDAMSIVCGQVPNVHAVIVGKEGRTSIAALQERIDTHRLQKRIKLLGERRDVPEIIAASDIGVSSSLGSEGNSRAALECMAMGLPLIVTNVGALPDLVVDGESGYVVPPGDAQPLAERIHALLLNQSQRITFGAVALQRIQQNYTEQAVAQRLIELYRQILELRNSHS